MNAFTAAFTIVAVVLLLTVSRRFAAVPLLAGALYVGRLAEIEIGPAHFTVLRILIAVGYFRMLARGEHLVGGVNSIDRAVLVWAALLLGTSAFHTADTWVFRAGVVWTEVGIYFLLRAFVRDMDDLIRVIKVISILLVPVALGMIFEKAMEQNVFVALGGDGAIAIRDGHVRARGPFAHAILAGTVGAACLPLALSLWRSERTYALLGAMAAAGVVFAATSTGPIMMMVLVCFGMLLWKCRSYMSTIRWVALGSAVALDLIMKDPVYFLMARIDIAGGSAGWHRARLIQSAIEHIDEWWLFGTDHTRHWMPTGVHANEIHSDITNHFVQMGVMGGLPLVLAFAWVLTTAFIGVGNALSKHNGWPARDRFLAWTLGAVLFAHVCNLLSISLFDQSVVFFYFILAAIGAAAVGKREWVHSAGTVPRTRKANDAAFTGPNRPDIDHLLGEKSQRPVQFLDNARSSVFRHRR